MAGVWLPTLLSVIIVSAVSFVGAMALALRPFRTHLMLLALVAFAAGALIGDSIFHLLPEATETYGGFPVELSLAVVGGFLAFYLLEVVLRWGHAHGEAEHPHSLPHGGEAIHIKPFAWTNLVADGIHNFTDGIVIAATYVANPALGVATTVAVAAHEIPQELGDFAVLRRAGLSARRALFYNFLSALLAVLGAVLVLIVPVNQELIARLAVPITAGGFLYIAAADLIPELHHHGERRYVPPILLGLLLGLAAMALLLRFE